MARLAVGKPDGGSMAVVELIGPTTKADLEIAYALDERTYEKGIRICTPK